MDSEFLLNIQERKKYIENYFNFPRQNEFITLNAQGSQTQNNYLIDINKKQATLERVTFQGRHRVNIILLRMDIGTKPHTNPDKTLISGNHIHIYKDGYHDTFAYELNDPVLNELNPAFDLTKFKTKNHTNLFIAFSEFCNFDQCPIIKQSFS